MGKFVHPFKNKVAEIAGNRNKITTFGMDATIQVPFFPKATKLSPYLVLGGGFSLENFDEAHLQFPIGIGANIFVGKNGSINLQAAYRKATLENRDNLEFGLGYLLRFQKRIPTKCLIVMAIPFQMKWINVRMNQAMLLQKDALIAMAIQSQMLMIHVLMKLENLQQVAAG
ncbi:MAG: hypothetical protein R2769_06025 [Saprospiraceae bacterium]